MRRPELNSDFIAGIVSVVFTAGFLASIFMSYEERIPRGESGLDISQFGVGVLITLLVTVAVGCFLKERPEAYEQMRLPV